MMINIINVKGIIAISSFALLVSACTGHHTVSLDSDRHHQNIDQTITSLSKQETEAKPLEISLQGAIDKALQDNLDARVAAFEVIVAQDNLTLEQLAALPNITVSGTYTERSDQAASSSESILTGTQSLEPSTSSEEQRQLANLELQWNLTDVIIAALNSHNARERGTVAIERLRTVQHNLERDVTNAYWNATIKQEALTPVVNLEKSAEVLQFNIVKAQEQKLISPRQADQKTESLMDQAESLNQLKEAMIAADIELKSLLTLPQEQKIHLTSTPQNILWPQDYSKKPMDDLIRMALTDRPEMREQYANRNIAIGNKRQEIMRTFPGLNLIYTRDYDSNGFLVNESWNNFSAALTQSLNAILTYNTRSNRAETQIQIEEARQVALAAAIIAQVNLNKMRLEMAKRQYRIAQVRYTQKQRLSSLTNQQSQLGAASGYDKRLSQMDAIEARIIQGQAFANLQRAHMDMVYSLGVSSRAEQYAEAQL